MRTTIERIGKYELRAILARTPLSTVYDGWDSDIARRVAVKLMPLSSVDDGEAGEAFSRFKRGAQAAGQLNHPNIVGIYDYGETDDYAYLVMEFVDGPTLKAMFDENRRFALSDICRIVGSVLDALQYSHDRGVVHRDVKPANIMMTAENQVKLTDFGIARLEDSEMTQAGMVIGTPAYMSPEQFLGEKIDLRTDVYSAGVVLYHLLTGDRPYEGNLATIMHKVLYGSPLSPSHMSTLVTPALDAVVTRAMARNREDRFSSAAEFNRALQAALTTTPIWPGVKDGLLQDAVRPSVKGLASPRPRALILSAVAAGVILIGGIGGWFAVLRPSTSTAVDQARRQEQQIKEQAARLQLEQEQARVQQEEQARQQQDQQARLEQEQQAAAQREQLERAQQEQQARLQQEQQFRAQQEQKARLQQEQQARLLQQQQEQARLQQDEQARIQQELRARQQQQDQARQPIRDQVHQKQDTDQGKQKLAQEQVHQRPVQELLRPKPETESPPPANTLPNPYPVTSISGAVGLVCESITADTAARFGLDSPQGMVVKGITVGGRADRAGIKEQDVILKINGSEVHELSGLNKLAASSPAGQTVPVDIFRRGSHKLVELQVN